MDRKQLAAIAAICGVVAAVAVLLPWYSVSMKMNLEGMGDLGSRVPGLAGAASGQSKSANGTEGDFNGTFVLILGLLGAAAAGLVAAKKTDLLPLDERQHLFAALALFALAVLLTLLDVFRDLPSTSQSSGSMSIEAGKAFGLYLTLLATVAGAAAAFLAIQKPATATSTES